MTNDTTKNSEAVGPKKVNVKDLLKPKSDGRKEDASVLDEADGAMFSRVSSNLDGMINNQDTQISDEIASPFEDVIVPVSVKLITAAPSKNVSNRVTDKERLLPRDEIDTSDIDILNDWNDIEGSAKDNTVLLDVSDEPGVCSVDHASFKRKTRGSEQSPYNDKHKVTDNHRNDCDKDSAQNETQGEDVYDKVVDEAVDTSLTCLEIDGSQDGEVSPFRAKYVCSLLFPFVSAVVFLADIGTDIELAVTYKRNGDTDLFYVTLACIIIPSAIMAAVDLSWMWIDRKSIRGGNCATAFRIVLGILSFGRIVRAISHMYHIFRKKTGPNKKWHRQRAIEQKRDCYMLDFINAFAESCPQLFVQMYLLYKYDLPLELIRVVSLLTSWISIAWTYAAYYRCSREALSGRQDVNTFGFLLFFFSVLAALAPRVLCVVLFLVYFKLWIGATVLTAHYLIMLVWIVLQKPKLEGTTTSSLGRFMYELLFAYVSMMCFMNLKDSPARIRMILFYVMIYVENCLLSSLVIWRMFYNDKHTGKPLNFVALPIGFVVHVTFLSLYYACLHPKTGRYKKANVI